MVQFGNAARLPQLPDVPTAQELAQTPDDLALVKFAELPLTIGYPFAAPPGVPVDRIAILRSAFQTVMAHPDYRADVLKAKLEYSPKNGSDLQVDIQNMARTPLAVTERYKKLAADGFGG